jgi:hypothetical protein
MIEATKRELSQIIRALAAASRFARRLNRRQ